ncbi:hypothetical protein EJ02DRAFT_478652 [Clathrospora elynae]|uniref:AA9 family lytic polysaccharide monooxygenase n=1 Tax=Clathrospora elynae TaxID=706981 RepID=A0A6A5SWL3_9PLEO|nr:hypothetical protein EJ02DRAFT_478652 [Clathrospora elynae]
MSCYEDGSVVSSLGASSSGDIGRLQDISCAECWDNGFVLPDMYNDETKIACDKDATAGAKVAKWSIWPESHVGPTIDYMAKVNDATFATAKDMKFLKIEAAGLENSKWAATKLIADNLTWTVTVPDIIAAGQYFLYPEIIALNRSGKQCLELPQPAGVTADKLYTPTDPGIKFDVYRDNSGYEILGPTIFDGASFGYGSFPAAPVASTPAVTTRAPAATSSAATKTSAASTPVAPATATAYSTQAYSAPVQNGSADTVEKEFTLDTFITWLQKEPGSLSSARVSHTPRAFQLSFSALNKP